MRLRDANRTFEIQLYAQIPAACNVALRGATGEASGEVSAGLWLQSAITQSGAHTFAGCLGAGMF
jgi:hypothetical protein